MYQEGTVIRMSGRICCIHDGKQEYQAFARKKIKGASSDQLKPIAVGDRVVFEVRHAEDAMIHEVLPRRTWLTRRSVKIKDKQQVIAANVDQMLIVTSVQMPAFHSGIIDRFLVAAQRGKLHPIIVLNKSDLKDKEPAWSEIEKKLSIYQEIGYEVVYASIFQPETLETLKQKLQGKSTVCTGHSGVGKSSLISTIDPSIRLRTGDVSEKRERGKHTTTSVMLFPLYFGGFIVDTPGIREFGFWHVDAPEISKYFPEMEPLLPQCKYKACTHTHEPSCAVKLAVEEEKIASFRYEGYCKILQGLEEERD